jgi:putative hemolysin
MDQQDAHLITRLAETEADRLGAERLRYKVFVEELLGDGPLVDHEGRFERDRFDAHADHLVLIDTRRDPGTLDHVVGTYRLMTDQVAADLGGFYSESEYDLSVLKSSGRRLLELGRSCVDAEYRGGTAMYHLWNALGAHVDRTGAEVLFGVASFHGRDPAAIAPSLSLLHHAHLAPPDLRVRAVTEAFQPMDLIPADQLDRPAAMRAVPALIKAYLRLGGFVGEGAFIDHAFNTIDVCLVMDTARLNARARAIYGRPRT